MLAATTVHAGRTHLLAQGHIRIVEKPSFENSNVTFEYSNFGELKLASVR